MAHQGLIASIRVHPAFQVFQVTPTTIEFSANVGVPDVEKFVNKVTTQLPVGTTCHQLDLTLGLSSPMKAQDMWDFLVTTWNATMPMRYRVSK